MSRAEELYTRMHYTRELTNQQILDLRQEIRDFFKSDAPEEEKEKLAGCTGGFNMLCSAIEEGYLEDRKPSKPKIPKRKYTFELEIPEFLKQGNEEKAAAAES